MEKKKLEELLKDFTAENLNQKYPLTEEEFKAVVILKRTRCLRSLMKNLMRKLKLR